MTYSLLLMYQIRLHPSSLGSYSHETSMTYSLHLMYQIRLHPSSLGSYNYKTYLAYSLPLMCQIRLHPSSLVCCNNKTYMTYLLHFQMFCLLPNYLQILRLSFYIVQIHIVELLIHQIVLLLLNTVCMCNNHYFELLLH